MPFFRPPLVFLHHPSPGIGGSVQPTRYLGGTTKVPAKSIFGQGRSPRSHGTKIRYGTNVAPPIYKWQFSMPFVAGSLGCCEEILTSTQQKETVEYCKQYLYIYNLTL